MQTPLRTILEDGFGKCRKCKEPLRSIGLISVFRPMFEQMASSAGSAVFSPGGVAFGNKDYNYDRRGGQPGWLLSSSSLVQEAEDAKVRADACKTSDRETAIWEYACH